MKPKKNLAVCLMTIAITATMVQVPVTANAAAENEKGLEWNFVIQQRFLMDGNLVVLMLKMDLLKTLLL